MLEDIKAEEDKIDIRTFDREFLQSWKDFHENGPDKEELKKLMNGRHEEPPTRKKLVEEEPDI